MEYVYGIADRHRVPVILDTDGKDKVARHQHLGMKLDRVRNCGDRLHMYDLIHDCDERNREGVSLWLRVHANDVCVISHGMLHGCPVFAVRPEGGHGCECGKGRLKEA